MAEVKNKIVTVESLSVLHEYNKTKYTTKEDVVPITNGGTGATTAADALTNLGVTATAAELNYVDGVTSDIQTQLDGKAASIHNHKAENLAPASLELHPGSSAGHGGYIDFHYNDSAADYTSRIIESASGTLQLNGFDIVTKQTICDWYNLSLTFTNGVATYTNSGIQAGDVIMVQRRGNMAGANLSFCTHTYSGYVTICTDSSLNATIAVNMLLTRL